MIKIQVDLEIPDNEFCFTGYTGNTCLGHEYGTLTGSSVCRFFPGKTSNMCKQDECMKKWKEAKQHETKE